jgi:hypothetical protein
VLLEGVLGSDSEESNALVIKLVIVYILVVLKMIRTMNKAAKASMKTK